ncbi:VanZ family protein [Erythrobacter alti]|uniref:VanZ family protein n=1 Tax=Erythrobacter alti TaxID=1896145 RepID=UPI0030F4302B
MIRALWFLCIAATMWFALIPPEMGGLGGTSYHGVAFMVLGLLTPAAFPRVPLVAIWILLLVFGGGIELAQGMMNVNRHSEWDDFVTDAFAATVGIVYYRIWLYLRARMARDDASSEEESDSASQDRK